MDEAADIQALLAAIVNNPPAHRWKIVARRVKTGNYSVYALADPRDKTIWYVGSSGRVQQRYREHCRGETSVAVAAWVRRLNAQGLRPLLRILEENIPDNITAWEREWHWTEVFLTEGAALLNSIGTEVREYYAQKGRQAAPSKEV